jgi:hypothetical protein
MRKTIVLIMMVATVVKAPAEELAHQYEGNGRHTVAALGG